MSFKPQTEFEKKVIEKKMRMIFENAVEECVDFFNWISKNYPEEWDKYCTEYPKSSSNAKLNEARREDE